MPTTPSSPLQSDGNTEAPPKKTRQTTRLKRLTLRTLDKHRPMVTVDPATGRASGPEKQKFHRYLGVVAREKIPIVYSNWKDVLETLKDIVWGDIFKKLLEEKRKKRQHEALLTENTPFDLEDPPSPIERHVKWKIARTKQYGQMTSEAAQQISDRIVRLITRVDDTGASRASSSSSTTLSQQQLADIIGNIKEQERNEFEEEHKQSLEKLKQELASQIKIELSQVGPQYFPLVDIDLQALAARVSTKGNVGHAIIVTSAMKTLKTSADGTNNQGTPKWIEVKSHVQSGGYECAYYVVHWMWNIVSGGLKNDWSLWFDDGMSLDMETITTIREKWATCFLKVQSIQCRKP
ncbi:hypothetical protein HKD37_01G000784 [Glycine soja]